MLVGNPEALVFTGGIGENSKEIRQMIVDGIACLGIKLDAEKNNVRGKKSIISTPDSKWKAVIMPTNEELMIARNTLEVLGIK